MKRLMNSYSLLWRNFDFALAECCHLESDSVWQQQLSQTLKHTYGFHDGFKAHDISVTEFYSPRDLLGLGGRLTRPTVRSHGPRLILFSSATYIKGSSASPAPGTGHLDDLFCQLQYLQDESNPGFVIEIVSLYFEESDKLLNHLANCLKKQIVDYKEVSFHVNELKGISASIGAQRVKNVCVLFRNSCEENNRDGCVRCLQKLQQECNVVKSKFGHLLMLEQQIVAAGGQVLACSKYDPASWTERVLHWSKHQSYL